MLARTLFGTAALLFLAGATAAQTVVFSEDFEGGLGGWTTAPLWHLADAASPCHAGTSTPFPSGTKCAWFGSETTCDFGTIIWWGNDFPALTLGAPIALPTGAPSLLLEFSTKSEGEADTVWDTWEVQVLSAAGAVLYERLLLNSDWTRRTIDVSQFAGQTVRLRFECWPGDAAFNEMLGWLVDDVVIRTGEAQARAMCSGDGIEADCPCGNLGQTGHGCATSFNPAGAELLVAGTGSVAGDTLALTASGVSNASVTIFQGANGLPTFADFNGDGILCASGNLLRIVSQPAAGGTMSYPAPGQTPISVRGQAAPGQLCVYQARFRNAAAFCTPATYNFTSGVELRWWP